MNHRKKGIESSANMLPRALLLFLLIVPFLLSANPLPKDAPIPQGKIEVSPETVAPAWQLIWDKARNMARSGEVEGAIALYQQLLHQRPGLSEARFELAVLLVKASRMQKAIFELEKVLEARPDYGRAVFVLATLLEQSGHYKRAIELYKRVLEQAETGEKNGAKKAAEVTPHLSDEDRFRAEMGLYHCYKGLNLNKDAQDHLKKALLLRPEDRSLELLLAYDLLEQGREREALPYLRRLWPANKTEPLFIKRYIRALLAGPKPEEAKELLEQMVSPLKNADQPLPEGLSEKDIPWAIDTLYNLYLMEDDTDAAIQLLQEIKDAYPDRLPPHLIKSLGRLYFGRQKYIAAIDTLAGLAIREPEDKDVYLFLARAYQHLQLTAKASDSYLAAYSLTQEPAYLTRALQLLAASEEFAQAKRVLDEYGPGAGRLETIPSRLLMRIYAGTGDLGKILELAQGEPGLLKDQDLARSCMSLLTTRALKGNLLQKDLWLYLRLLDELMGHPQGNKPWIMSALEVLGQRPEKNAMTAVLNSLWRRENWYWAALRIVDASAERPGLSALKILTEGLSEDPRFRLLRAELLLQDGAAEQAIQMLKDLPDQGMWLRERVYLHLGEICRIQHRYEKGLTYYDRLLALYPNHLEARRGRVSLYFSYGLGIQANWDALGIFLISGEYPALVAEVQGSSPAKIMAGDSAVSLSTQEVLNSKICESGSDACEILLALSHEKSGHLKEAVITWQTFLRRHSFYWPGYVRLARVLSVSGDEKGAERIREEACRTLGARLLEDSPVPWPPLPDWSGRDPQRLWAALEQDALGTWQSVFCGK